jgi:hypothetical protein
VIKTAVCSRVPKVSCLEWVVKPRRFKVWENNPSKTCTEKNGFKHYDIVRAVRKNRVVIGSIQSLKAKEIKLRTKHSNDFLVSYSKTNLIQRSVGLIYLY